MTKVGEQELDNLQLANMIAASLDKQLKYNLVDFHSSRPGHDLRWAEDQTESFHIHEPFGVEKGEYMPHLFYSITIPYFKQL